MRFVAGMLALAAVACGQVPTGSGAADRRTLAVDSVPPLERLRATGARFRPYAPKPARAAGGQCTVIDGVELLRGATGLRWSRPPRVNAVFALRLVRFEVAAQEEAQAVFGRRVRRIEHLGSFVCRSVAGAPSVVSQHAFGNALDVAAFVLEGGTRVSIETDFPRAGTVPATAKQRFLARLVERLARERIFGSLLTPDFDRRHANHLHLDGRPHGWWWPLLG